MKLNSFKIRSSLWGTTALAITSILFCTTLGCGRDKIDTDNLGSPLPIVSEVSTTWITSTTTSTVTTSSTSTSTTTTTTTEETTSTSTTTQMTTMPQSTAPIEEEIIVEPICTESEFTELPITEQEFTLIANVISHEAGSLWITEYERSCIVAAIMNRVADSRFPSTIDAVVHQSGQMFDVPYYRIDYTGIGYEPIDNAIYAYFNGKYSYGLINSWSGDGQHNYFTYK